MKTKIALASTVTLVVLVAAGLIANRVGGWSLVKNEQTTNHGDVIEQTLAVRELCGAEVNMTWDLSEESDWEPLPDIIASRTVTGTVRATALACSVGTPVVTITDGEVQVSLTTPRIAYAFVDVDMGQLPQQSRGVFDRIVDGVGCLVSDCGSVVAPLDSWLDSASVEAWRAAAQTNAVETAQTEIAEMVTELVTPVSDLSVKVKYTEPEDV